MPKRPAIDIHRICSPDRPRVDMWRRIAGGLLEVHRCLRWSGALYIRIRITMKLIDIEYMMMCLRIYPNLKLAWYAALFEKKKEGGPCDHLTLS